MRGDIVSVDVDRSQIVWMALAGCLAVATMFCVDLVAAVRLKAEKMAKERKDARALRWTGRLTRTASKRLSKPPSQKEIESNLSKGSREAWEREASEEMDRELELAGQTMVDVEGVITSHRSEQPP